MKFWVLSFGLLWGMSFGQVCTGSIGVLSASASSTEISTFSADKAVDGSTSTRWNSDAGTNEWLAVDLGFTRTVSGVQIEWDEAFATSYQVQYSTNGVNFVNAISTSSGNGQDVEHIFSPVEARYLRLAFSSGTLVNGQFWGYSVQELRVYSNCAETGVSVPQVLPLPNGVVLTNKSTWSYQDGVSLASDNYSQAWSTLISSIVTEANMSSSGTPLSITLNAARTDLGAEGYELDLSGDSYTLTAATSTGIFYGIQSLRQMWLSGKEHESMLIKDVPTLAWRGLMLDIARNFMPLEYLKKTVDRMATLKMNRLHLHLTDDQGWRIEIKSHPQLHLVGSQSSVATTGGQPKNPGYLTQAQYSELVDYATKRAVVIVPEIDLPGHTHAVKAAYPEFGCGENYPWPNSSTAVGYSKLCLDKPEVYDFVEDILDEVIALTPTAWIHIGGDEISDSKYGSFITFLDQYVSSKGKVMVGWQEVLSGSLSSNSIYQQWNTGVSPSSQPWINSYCENAYLDQPEYFGGPGLTWCADVVNESDVYSTAPGTEGIEVALWGEVVPDTATATDRLFPRLYAAAEANWTSSSRKSYTAYTQRRSVLENYLIGSVPNGLVSLIAKPNSISYPMRGPAFYTIEGRPLLAAPKVGRYVERDAQGGYRVRVQR